MDMQWKCINETLPISAHNIIDKVSHVAHFFYRQSYSIKSHIQPSDF